MAKEGGQWWIMAGTAMTRPNDGSLPTVPAMIQHGPHRWSRGQQSGRWLLMAGPIGADCIADKADGSSWEDRILLSQSRDQMSDRFRGRRRIVAGRVSDKANGGLLVRQRTGSTTDHDRWGKG